MNIAIGIIRAPRPVSTVEKCIESLRKSFTAPIFVFQEPSCEKMITSERTVVRPYVFGPDSHGSLFYAGPEGQLGNFQNWIQTARDLLWKFESCDTFLIAEDDALFAPGIRELLERDLWPSADCGAVSLYSPNMIQYTATRGLIKMRPLNAHGELTGRNNLVGSLALVFPRHVLAELVEQHKSIDAWSGSHDQRKRGAAPWERKAVDTWIGRTLQQMGKSIWHYSPSIVMHYSPLPAGQSNSSLGHPAPNGTQSVRQCRNWIGDNPGDLRDIYPKPKERHDLHTSQV